MSIVELQPKDLKSNMDRFIVKSLFYLTKFFKDLKSNMDRFIEQFYCNGIHIHFEFKIQYG